MATDRFHVNITVLVVSILNVHLGKEKSLTICVVFYRKFDEGFGNILTLSRWIFSRYVVEIVGFPGWIGAEEAQAESLSQQTYGDRILGCTWYNLHQQLIYWIRFDEDFGKGIHLTKKKYSSSKSSPGRLWFRITTLSYWNMY